MPFIDDRVKQNVGKRGNNVRKTCGKRVAIKIITELSRFT